MSKNKRLFILGLLIATALISTINLKYQDDLSDSNNNIPTIKSAGHYNLSPFYIDDSETGVGAKNWTWAVGEAWCYGSGTWDDPYIIENITIEGNWDSSGIEIVNSNKYFIIRNCTIFHTGLNPSDAAIELTNVNNGTIYNNSIYDVSKYGINIDLSSNITIYDNTLINQSLDGIYLGSSCNNNNITNNVIDGAYRGIHLLSNINNTVENNNVSRCTNRGIYAKNNGYHQIIGNIIRDCESTGLHIEFSDFNNISFNTLVDNGIEGIYIDDSENITIKNNTMTNEGLYLLSNSGTIAELASHTIDLSNKINGKIVYYYYMQNNLGSSDFTDAGQVILVNCNSSLISNYDLSNGTIGITLYYSENNIIENNNLTNNNDDAISLYSCSNNTIRGNSMINNNQGINLKQYSLFNNISNNIIMNCSDDGIQIITNSHNNTVSKNQISRCYGEFYGGMYIYNTHNHTISDNNVTDCIRNGIDMSNSDNTTLTGNFLAGNNRGIDLQSCDYSNFFNNNITNNTAYGVYIYKCTNLTLKDNLLTNDGIFLSKGTDPISTLTYHSIDTSNKVNGKPIYYYNNSINLGSADFINAGQIILTYCNDSIISNHDFSNGAAGVSLFYCNNITVSNNNINNVDHYGAYGIYTSYTPNCLIIGNNISGTLFGGIYFTIGSNNNNVTNNKIYNNHNYGIYASTSHNLTFSDNEWYGNEYRGMYLTASQDSIVKNNVVYNNTPYGIHTANSCLNTTIYGNNITNNGEYGILINGDTDVSVYGNNVSKNQLSGIYVKDSTDINVTGNNLDENVEYGIFNEACNNLIIKENNFTKCGLGFSGSPVKVMSTITDLSNLVNGKTLYIYMNNNTLTSNDLIDAGQIVLLECDNAQIYNLELVEGSAGIFLYYSDYNTVVNVSISLQNVYGIYCIFSDHNYFSRNSLTNNTNGIYLDRCENNTFFWNEINNNLNYGVWDDECLNTTISSNNISGNGINGIHFKRTINATVYNNTIQSNNFGIMVDVNSDDNLIYMNNFSVNVVHALDDGLDNSWDNGTIGNYWDNFTDKDTDDDGIADNLFFNIAGASVSNDTKPIYWDAPVILVSSPVNYTLHGKIAPSYSVLVDEGRGDTFWYELIETGGNFSEALAGGPDEIRSGQLNQSLWNALSNGTKIIRFYVNDSRGYTNFTDVILWVDKIDPAIGIISPNAFDILGKNYPFYNLTIVSDNFHRAWYTLDGGSNNYSIIGAVVGENTGNLNPTAWDAIVADGNYLLNFYANETSGNIVNCSVWIEKDITDPIINITRPLNGITITDTVPDFNYSASDKNPIIVRYSLNNGVNTTVSGNGTIDADLWNALSDGTVFITFYAIDSAGNIGMDMIVVTKSTTTGGNGTPPGGIDPMLMIIIIGVIAVVAVASIVVISKRSKKEVREKEEEIKTLKEQRGEITEDDILISKERRICLVHKGPVGGMSYICPECGAYYCVKCYNVIKGAENECWSCSTPLDASKPSIKKKKQAESKKKKKKEEIKITEEEGEEKIEFEKKMEDPKKHKAPKTDLTPLPTKPTAPEKKLTIRAPVVEKPEEIPEPKTEAPVEAPVEAPLIKVEAIKKFDDYIEQLNAMVEKLDIKFSAGTISQEEYIEKKTMLAEKLGEAMAKRDQLKE